MKTVVLLLSFAAIISCSSFTLNATEFEAEKTAVQKVIEDSYVKGIHIDRDVEAIRKGFHPSFTMFIKKNGDVTTWSIEDWIEKIEEGKKEHPEPSTHKTTHKFSFVDVTGNAAVARIEIYKDGAHIYTDYMSLYKFKDGWKIVGKIYYRHK